MKRVLIEIVLETIILNSNLDFVNLLIVIGFISEETGDIKVRKN